VKVLVATKITQGRRKNDFAHATDDELVTFSEPCDGEPVDGTCGCQRSFSGLESLRATTTAIVVDRPDLTAESLASVVATSLTKSGYADILSADDLQKRARQDAAELLRIAAAFPLAAIVEKRGDKVQLRPLQARRGRSRLH
jgi:hypothetical protein